MKREETIALFEACELARATARATALDERKNKWEAEEIEHQAAKAHWNAWADALLAERKKLDRCGLWKPSRQFPSELEEGENRATKAWIKRAIVNFTGYTFDAMAQLQGFIFPGAAWFDEAVFADGAWFQSATFRGSAKFNAAKFKGEANFECASFLGPAVFNSAEFEGTSRFNGITFSRDASFDKTSFNGDAVFGKTVFLGPATYFRSASFKQKTDFKLAYFKQHADFGEAAFEDFADFEAIRSDGGFNMAYTIFRQVPNFVQAHFEEPPRLDNLEAGGKRKDADLSEPLLPARWRALKRLAVQGQDMERELEFHAQEMRSQRCQKDQPRPRLCSSNTQRGNAGHFFFGLFYDWFSDFGRSVLRPFLLWALSVVVGALFYVSLSPGIGGQSIGAQKKAVYELSLAGWHALLPGDDLACYAGEQQLPIQAGPNCPATECKKDAGSDPGLPPYIGALSKSLRDSTNIGREAWHLAFRNAFIVLDGSGDAAHRTYGCLYGVELYGGSNPLAVVPSAVSTVSAIQKLFSALMIFLFGLALRNMLKMK